MTTKEQLQRDFPLSWEEFNGDIHLIVQRYGVDWAQWDTMTWNRDSSGELIYHYQIRSDLHWANR
jgi:hypothetical protein